jgi:hypothetical protein
MVTDPNLTAMNAATPSQPSSGRIQGAPVRHRRSGRIARRLDVRLRWREQGGDWQEAAAVTQVLSRFGCMLSGQCRIRLGEEIQFLWPEKQRETPAKVVFRALDGSSEVQLALEFLGTDDFWGIDFPPSFMSIMT